MNIADISGWIAMIGLIIAYFGLSAGAYRSDSKTYLGLNIAASIVSLINTVAYSNWAIVALNIAFILISVAGIKKYDIARFSPSSAAYSIVVICFFIFTALLFVITGSLAVTLPYLAWLAPLIFIGAYMLFVGGEMGKLQFLAINCFGQAIVITEAWSTGNNPLMAQQASFYLLGACGIVRILIKPGGEQPQS